MDSIQSQNWLHSQVCSLTTNAFYLRLNLNVCRIQQKTGAMMDSNLYISNLSKSSFPLLNQCLHYNWNPLISALNHFARSRQMFQVLICINNLDDVIEQLVGLWAFSNAPHWRGKCSTNIINRAKHLQTSWKLKPQKRFSHLYAHFTFISPLHQLQRSVKQTSRLFVPSTLQIPLHDYSASYFSPVIQCSYSNWKQGFHMS